MGERLVLEYNTLALLSEHTVRAMETANLIEVQYISPVPSAQVYAIKGKDGVVVINVTSINPSINCVKLDGFEDFNEIVAHVKRSILQAELMGSRDLECDYSFVYDVYKIDIKIRKSNNLIPASSSKNKICLRWFEYYDRDAKYDRDRYICVRATIGKAKT